MSMVHRQSRQEQSRKPTTTTASLKTPRAGGKGFSLSEPGGGRPRADPERTQPSPFYNERLQGSARMAGGAPPKVMGPDVGGAGGSASQVGRNPTTVRIRNRRNRRRPTTSVCRGAVACVGLRDRSLAHQRASTVSALLRRDVGS